jgi:hypothetical protein
LIDWFNLFANALWIVGCSIALATLSFASWQASERGEKLLVRLRSRSAQFWLNLAVVVFCLGMAGTESRLVFRVIWILLAGWYLYQTLRQVRTQESS